MSGKKIKCSDKKKREKSKRTRAIIFNSEHFECHNTDYDSYNEKIRIEDEINEERRKLLNKFKPKNIDNYPEEEIEKEREFIINNYEEFSGIRKFFEIIVFYVAKDPIQFISTIKDDFEMDIFDRWYHIIFLGSIKKYYNLDVTKYILKRFKINVEEVHESATDRLEVFKTVYEITKNVNFVVINFYHNFNKGNMDMLDYILENFDSFERNEEIFSRIINWLNDFHKDYMRAFVCGGEYPKFGVNNIDIYTAVLRKFPNFFDNFDDYTIICNFDTLDMLRRLNFGRKINPTCYFNNADFIKECGHDMGLKDYIQSDIYRKHNPFCAHRVLILLYHYGDYIPTAKELRSIVEFSLTGKDWDLRGEIRRIYKFFLKKYNDEEQKFIGKNYFFHT